MAGTGDAGDDGRDGRDAPPAVRPGDATGPAPADHPQAGLPPAGLPPAEPAVTIAAEPEQPAARPPAVGAAGGIADGQEAAAGAAAEGRAKGKKGKTGTEGRAADKTEDRAEGRAADGAAAGNAVGDGDAEGPAATAVAGRLDELARRLEELARLRRHDADLVDRLHAENTRLRAGELTEAMSPLLRGLMRLHDQMTSLGADDGQSVAGILRTQLLQIMDVAVDVRPYTAVVGMPFDPARHVGVRRIGTDDAKRDRTIARTVRPGFVRGESIVVRPAEVEVFRAH
ncbi:nucleotide exchange factor GrpE [Frankia sp. CiP1_Cm_nod2]|uniref:nucleotide exchange factor GrpE n=2 Tax=unclassified Frankia TaxID=2632575 RepID=UPI002024114B